MQLSERDNRLDAMECELQSCYKLLGESQAEHLDRCERDRMSIGGHSSRRYLHRTFDAVGSPQGRPHPVVSTAVERS
jgi:hypothetical protein